MIIHRLWLGPWPMPARFRGYAEAWARLNRCEVVDWSWHNLPEDLANGDVMDDLRARTSHGGSIELATALADIIDYDLVARFGGCYVNCDMEPVRSLPLSMITGDGAWVASEDAQHLVNSAFGGPAGHPFWAAVVAALPERYWRLTAAGEREMNQLTGPHLLRQVADALPGQVAVCPPAVFSPVHWSQIPPGSRWTGSAADLPPEAIALHHWDHRRTGRTNIVQ